MFRKWLSRFAFSFLIVGIVLLWQGYKLRTAASPTEAWRWVLCFVGAGASLALAGAGIRARHRDGN
jgi:hypothetical protein